LTLEERAAALENDILAYIRHLRAAEKLSLTVHLMQFNPYRHMDFGNLYTVHPNPLCVYLKSDVRLMDHCIERQTKVVERAARGRYCGMCWAGVTEYVYPIRDPEGRIAAFISVSGYGVERERALPRLIRACRAHGLDEARAVEIFDKQLPRDLPDEARLDSLVMPLSHMCSLLFYYAAGTRGAESRVGAPNSAVFYTEMIRYIESVYTSDLSLEDICARFGCSASYASRLFRKYGGAGFCGIVNRLRVELAKSFLLSSDLSVQEISRIAGFSDPNYFSTVFRKAAGLSPRAWRTRGETRSIVEMLAERIRG
jgi:AraC-like DNA-binding protein